MASRCRTAVRPSPTFLGPSGTGDAPGVGPVAPELVMNLIITVNARGDQGGWPPETAGVDPDQVVLEVSCRLEPIAVRLANPPSM